ncbi:retrovirus-related pol polyprotein from transposon TNT 1-94, partial [Tanacetum coccineum]
MTGDRSRLMNFVKKFIGTVRFGNDHFGAIMGYGDYVIGESVISRVYYVEGLGHNLFSVGQFCDSDLEVAFRKHSCYVRDTDGVELLKGSRGSNLYTISVEDMMKSSPICLLSKASKHKSWLWHRRLNHLNFGTINDLARKDLVRGLPRLKFEKDHLCSIENLGKLQPTADIGIFVGYAPNRKGYRIYNKRTRQIMETIHVTFDELTERVAHVQSSPRPAPNLLTPGPISSGLLRMLCGASTIPYCPKSNRKTSNLQLMKECWFQDMQDEIHELIDWTYGISTNLQSVQIIALKWIYKGEACEYDIKSKPSKKHLEAVRRGISVSQGTFIWVFGIRKTHLALQHTQTQDHAGCQALAEVHLDVLILGDKLIKLVIKKQICTSHLVLQSEYIAMSGCVPKSYGCWFNYQIMGLHTIASLSMANAEHAPAMASPVRTDEQIVPRNRWVPIGKSNCYLNEEKSQRSPIFKIAVDILKQTNFFRAFTASSTIPAIYIQQFWDTIRFDNALQITPVDNNRAFSSPPTPDTLVEFVNKLGYPKEVIHLSNVTTNDMFQPWRALKHYICAFTGKTSGFERPRAQRQKEVGTTYSGEEESNSYPYPKYQEPVLGHLKFSAKGSKREVFGMTIPNELINNVIRGADYYDAYLEKVAKHQRYIAGEELSDPESPAPKPAKPTKQQNPKHRATNRFLKTKAKKSKHAPAKPKEKKRKPVSESSEAQPLAKRAKAGKVVKKRTVKSSKQLVDEFVDEGVPVAKPSLEDTEEAILQKVLEESLTDVPNSIGVSPSYVFRETDTRKFQPLPEVPGKGKEKVGEETRASSSNFKTPKRELSDNTTSKTSGNQDEGQAGLDHGTLDEGQAGSDLGTRDGGQAGLDHGTLDEGQAGPNPDDINIAKSLPLPTPSVLAGPNLEHSDVEITGPSSQPQPEHMDEGFTASAYPDVHKNLKLTVDEQVIPEEPVSSTGTLSSLQHLAKDFSFGDQFLNDKPSEADNEKTTADTEAESMASVTIQQDTSITPPMTSPVIDLVSRPHSPNVHWPLPTTTITTAAPTTTTTTTTLPLPPQLQQSSSE